MNFIDILQNISDIFIFEIHFLIFETQLLIFAFHFLILKIQFNITL